MADKKISQLTAATTPLAGTEVLPIVQSGTTVKVSIADVTAGRAMSATSIATGLGAVGTPSYTFTGDTNTGMWSPSADTAAFSTAGSERMRINSDGAVGVATASPTASVSLTVQANAGNAIAQNIRGRSDGIGVLIFSDNSDVENGRLDFRTNYAEIKQARNAPLVFSTNATERMRIDSSGDVGIGTSTTSSGYGAGKSVMLTNQSSVLFQNASNAWNTTTAGGGVTYYSNNNLYLDAKDSASNILFRVNGATERMRIDSSGNVGIGTPSPSFQLQLSTDSAAKPTTNLWTIASDSRIKTETGEYTKGLAAVCALRPVTYRYNGSAGFVDDGKENISIIAQEAAEHFPECVGTFEVLLNADDEEKTELFNWNGHALIFALVNAVKELKAMNEALAARLSQIEGA